MDDINDINGAEFESAQVEFYDPAKEHFISQNRRNEFLSELKVDRTSFRFSSGSYEHEHG